MLFIWLAIDNRHGQRCAAKGLGLSLAAFRENHESCGFPCPVETRQDSSYVVSQVRFF